MENGASPPSTPAYIPRGKPRGPTLQTVAFYAPLYLNEAQKNIKNWNYGNAIFEAHLALSHMAFEKNDKSLAREHLIKASETPGSPQLDSFGPFIGFQTDYFLALAKAGEKESLIKFANNCKNFVNKKNQKKMSPQELKNDQLVRGSIITALDKFIDQIQNGKTPDFNP